MNKPILCILLLFVTATGKLLTAQNLIPFKLSEELNKWGYKDTAGNVIIYWHFEEADSFNENGYARIKYHGMYGYINDKANFIVAPKYYQLGPIVNDSIDLNWGNYIVKIGEKFVETGEAAENEYEQLPKLIVFRYPQHESLVKDLINEQYRIDLHIEKNKIPAEDRGYGVCLISSVIGWKNEKAHQSSIASCNYFSSSQLINNKLRLGAGIIMGRSMFWEEDSVMKSRFLGLGLAQCIRIEKKINLTLEAYPIIARNIDRRKRGEHAFDSKSDPHSNNLGILLG